MRPPAYRKRDMDQADAAFFLIAATVAQAATEIINGTNMQSNCHIVRWSNLPIQRYFADVFFM